MSAPQPETKSRKIILTLIPFLLSKSPLLESVFAEPVVLAQKKSPLAIKIAEKSKAPEGFLNRRSWMNWLLTSVMVSLMLLTVSIPVVASGITVFSKTYTKANLKPNVFTDTFTLSRPGNNFKIVVQNGKDNTSRFHVSGALILINGKQIFDVSEFSKTQVHILTRGVVLEKTNKIRVELRGKPDDCITINIMDLDANTPPAADAGPDQSTSVTQSVTLDGSRSADADRDPITYAWSFVSRPSGSVAVLSNPSVVNPTFNVDKPGTYIVQLTVNDGKASSLPDTVFITTLNRPPIANAGPDQTISAGATVTLDGSGSMDADSDPLTFLWAFTSRPAGSVAALSDPTAMNPTFIPDHSGTYGVQVIVNDGNVNSAADTVTITATATTSPQPVITSPANLSLFSRSPIDISGTISESASVTCNGTAAAVVGLVFSASGVPLSEGSNTITCQATNAAGNVGTISTQVILDSIPPQLIVTAPANLSVINNSPINVSGTISESVSTTCNGIPASVIGLTFSASGVPLVEGSNTVMCQATDAAGNLGTVSAHVILDSIAPQVGITSPANFSVFNKSPVDVSGTISESALVTCNGFAASVSGLTFSASGLPLVEGSNTITCQATDPAGNLGAASLQVILDSIPPQFAVTTPLNGAVLFDDLIRVAGTMQENAVAVSVNGQLAALSNGQWELNQLPLIFGENIITVIVSDAAGNSSQQTLAVTRRESVLESIKISPLALRFSEAGIDRPLSVTGQFTNGSTQDLTPGNNGTSYESSNPFVARIGTDGIVSAVANGETTITARHLAFTATSRIVVEVGVTLDALSLSPAQTTLRASGMTQQLRLRGTFSDGSERDLAASTTGTIYKSSVPGAAIVSIEGLVTAVADGTTAITAFNENLNAAVNAEVIISDGAGFFQGEVYNDSKGLPLAQAIITLLSDGSGTIGVPGGITADERGQFLLQGMAGDALVRMEKEGFTSVERKGPIPQNTAFTLLDARLTPLDPQVSQITSVIGGRARNAADTISLQFGPGSLQADAAIQLTAISNQGLKARPPLGWSPVAAVDVHPAGITFVQPALLRLQNTLNLSVNSEVTAAFYDPIQHRWIVQEPARVTQDGRYIELLMQSSSQVALFLPDAAPFIPSVAEIGKELPGVLPVALPPNPTASGKVVPRSAPAGEGIRADGNVTLAGGIPLPSGTAIQVHVSELYDLYDASTATPPDFTQDLLLYAFPHSGGEQDLGTAFPITPSWNFTILDLALGKVRLDVMAPKSEAGGTVVGAAGDTITDPSGLALEIPAGALSSNSVVNIFPLAIAQSPVSIPAGFDLLGSAELNFGGAILAQAAVLSIARPPTLPDGAQIIIAQAITDPSGVRRLRIVAMGQLQTNRIVSQSLVNGLSLPGISVGGKYLFLRPTAPLGFITGKIFATDGIAPQALSVVTGDSAPFADVTFTSGNYIIAGEAGVNTNVAAIHVATHNAANGVASVTGPNATATLNLVMGAVALRVVSVSPADAAANVPRDISISVQFSSRVNPASVNATSYRLLKSGALVAGQLQVAPDGLSATFTPSSPLESNTGYTVTLTAAITDFAGNALLPFAPASFATLDTSKPPQPPPGQIRANLPDEDGMVLIYGTLGTAEPSSGVTATNLGSQESITVLAESDGSFRLRIPVLPGDDLALTLRNTSGQEVTIAITQFENEDGTTALWAKGGTVLGPGGRKARILPRALSAMAIVKLSNIADVSILPALPSNYRYADSFDLQLQGGAFNQLKSIVLSESQNRFAPGTALAQPFRRSGSLVVPFNFLVNGNLNFSATAEDVEGNRHSAAGSTFVVGVNPIAGISETSFDAEFPTVFLSAPKEALPNQQVIVEAIAPTARIDFELPAPEGLVAGTPLLLARVTQLNGETKLSILDRLEVKDVSGALLLKTNGRDLPGASAEGPYSVIASDQPIAFVTGRITGPAATVSINDSPFVFEASEPNAIFNVPVVADRPFTLSFIDPGTGQVKGMVSGQAPSSGAVVDLGMPLGAIGGVLYASAQLDANSLVDINSPLIFTFSEPIDRATITASTILVTDSLGNRIFGQMNVSSDGTQVTFSPLRRWRFGTTFRYGVSTGVLALSGARLHLPLTGEFTTFTPEILNRVDVDVARDVAIAGNLAAVGGAVGLSFMDIGDASSPHLLSQIPIDGGVSGVSMLSGADFLDRNGSRIAGTLGLAAAGDEGTAGRLKIFDINNAGTPVLLGEAQLSVPAGQVAPNGVPNSPGVPSAVAVDSSLKAIVAVQTIGVETVSLSAAIPANVADPASALGSRFPVTGFENVNHVAILQNKVLVAGINGLTLLDGTTFAKLGSISTTGNAVGIAGAAAYPMDVNGDGTIDPALEVFDLAVVANGSDGTLQFFNISDPTNPRLISAVRLGGEALSVVLDSKEQLAYVGSGAGGLSIVDLAGSASIQPIDLDRNGVDDRLFGEVAVSGSAERIALDSNRGVGYVASGVAGLSVVQLLPPRAYFRDVQRDPVATFSGDEESILNTRRAFLTDDRIHITVEASSPPNANLSLTIQEAPSNGGARRVTFLDGGIVVPLTAGTNVIDALILHDSPSSGSQVSFQVLDANGAVIARFSLQLAAPPIVSVVLQSLFLAPAATEISASQLTAQLNVGGFFSDGRILNLTSATSGTSYVVENISVASVDADGLATAHEGGITSVFVSNGGIHTSTRIRVTGRAPSIDAIYSKDSFITLNAAGVQRQLVVLGRIAGNGLIDITQGGGVLFVSSDPSIAAVDADGLVTSVSEGTTTILATKGALSASVRISVDFRPQANLTRIDLSPFGNSVRSDATNTMAQATVSGSGALEGQTVTFSLSGVVAAQFTAVTDYAGIAVAALSGLTTPGTVTVTATVNDPSTGNLLSDTQQLSVTAAGIDSEPNDDANSAKPLTTERNVSGTVGAGDLRDTYLIEVATAGTLKMELMLAQPPDPGAIALILTPANGMPIRFDMNTGTIVVSQAIPAGLNLLTVETTGPGAAYTLATSLTPVPVVVDAVSPTSGAWGTEVIITGSGFSLNPAGNIVLFGIIKGKVVAATPEQLRVLVPANAIDAAIEVIVGPKGATGPVFSTGVAAPPPSIQLTAPDPNMIRLDPVTGTLIDITRLRVYFDPGIQRSDVASFAASLGGTIQGFIPAFNAYILEFLDIQTVASLEARRRQIEANAMVLMAARSTIAQPDIGALTFDARDNTGVFPSTGVPQDAALSQSRIFEAIEAIRQHPDFQDPAHLRNVKVAIIDTGFDPLQLDEFKDKDGAIVVQMFNAVTIPGSPPTMTIQPSVSFSDPRDHGTGVTSVIAATNRTGILTGVFAGLWQPNEKPVQVYVYKASDSSGNLQDNAIHAALADIKARGDIDVVNISAGTTYVGSSSVFNTDNASYRASLGILQPRTLIVTSAGNDNQQTDYRVPSGLATALPNVMSVGAVAVADLDATGEGPDARARFPVGASNFGATVTIAAPGEDVVTAATILTSATGYRRNWGTSIAAPMVAGVGAMLQTICPALCSPDDLKRILVESADDIIGVWSPGPMGRLNALGAVRRVLSPAANQFIWVADQEFPISTTLQGGVIAIDVDPLTGEKVAPPVPDHVIPLSYTKGSLTFNGNRPTAIAVSPTGGKAYVVVEAADPAYGDGVLVVDTQTLLVDSFIAFSGAQFGTVGPLPPPVKVVSGKPGLVFSPDGRLLYVGTSSSAGPGITIINTVSRRVISRLTDLPPPYDALASAYPVDPLPARFADLAAKITTGFPDPILVNRPGRAISSLDISPDGKILYAAIESGTGSGSQPGAVIPINVDLYTDGSLAAGLQSDLTQYFTLALPTTFMQLPEPGSFAGGDEPKTVAASPDGKHVYLVHGGVNFFQGYSPDPPDILRFQHLLNAALIGAALGALAPDLPSIDASGGVPGMLNAILSGMGNTAGAAGTVFNLANFSANAMGIFLGVMSQARAEVAATLNAGYTLVSAPGYTGVFCAPGAAQCADPLLSPGTFEMFYPSSMPFGWNVPPSGGGLTVSQFRSSQVFASRPFGMAIRPDGQRALVPFFQTGNFGVLDLSKQQEFEIAPPSGGNTSGANPIFAALPDSLFKAVVAVTPAARLNSHLWPVDGSFIYDNTVADLRKILPSPDESVLGAADIKYSQNGRFAVASHTGIGIAPQPFPITMPDFGADVIGVRLPLQKLGFTITSQTTALDPDGTSVSVGSSYTFHRGGGAITVINDKAITDDFAAHVNAVSSDDTGHPRAYFSITPVCKIPGLYSCVKDVYKRLHYFEPTSSSRAYFHRPRGVAIQPFITIEEPRFGDFIGQGTALQIRWRDPRITQLAFGVYDLTPPGGPVLVTGDIKSLTTAQLNSKTLQRTFGSLFSGPAAPITGRAYRVEVIGYTSTGDEFSKMNVEVRYFATAGPPACVPATVTFSPGTPSILFLREKKTVTYQITLQPGDTLVSPPKTFITSPVELHLEDGDLDVAITPSTFSGLSGTFMVELLDPVALGHSTKKYATKDFKINIFFETERCGIQRKSVTIHVVPNTSEAQREIKDVPPEIDPRAGGTMCRVDIDPLLGTYESRLRSKLPTILGFNPFVNSPSGPGNTILIEVFPGNNVAVEVQFSKAFLRYLLEVDNTPLRDPNNPPSYVYTQGTEEQPATAPKFNSSLPVSIEHDITSTAPTSCGLYTGSVFSLDYRFELLLQVVPRPQQ